MYEFVCIYVYTRYVHVRCSITKSLRHEQRKQGKEIARRDGTTDAAVDCGIEDAQ